tara:strand:+ start:41 stop:988 length:948 start_codon:yes stop_codon:yes gene_type:complete
MGLRDFFKIDNTPPGTKRRAEAAAKKKRNKGRVGGDNEAAMAADKARRAAIVKKARPMFKIDNTPPGTKRRAEAEAKKKSAVAKKSVMAKKIASRDAKETARQDKAKAKTAVSRPTPKRPSAISLKNAAEQKAKRPMKPQVPPTSRVKPPKADGRGTVTGKGGRNVGGGAYERANVTKEQLDASGMSLRNYLNFMDKNGKRPPKAKKAPGGKKMNYKPKKMMGGGMAMKTKMGTKGGAMGGAKGYKDGGKLPMVEKDGKMIPAYAADGKGKMMTGGPVKKMKTKGYSKGGVAGGKRNKVRGAGIARKGVRPAKMV